jgi:hypothetical protein
LPSNHANLLSPTTARSIPFREHPMNGILLKG